MYITWHEDYIEGLREGRGTKHKRVGRVCSADLYESSSGTYVLLDNDKAYCLDSYSELVTLVGSRAIDQCVRGPVRRAGTPPIEDNDSSGVGGYSVSALMSTDDPTKDPEYITVGTLAQAHAIAALHIDKAWALGVGCEVFINGVTYKTCPPKHDNRASTLVL